MIGSIARATTQLPVLPSPVVSLFVYEARFRATPGGREELVSGLPRAADPMRSVPGCVRSVIGRPSGVSDEVRVFEVRKSKEAHDQGLNHPAVRELIGEVLPISDGKPIGESWIVRSGKGIVP
jgi:quinol monooxygenase YgiN